MPVTLDLAGAIPESELTGSSDLRLTGLSAGSSAVWLAAQDAHGGPHGALIRLDAATGEIRRIAVECGSGCAAPAVGTTSTWTVMNDGGTPSLVRVEASGAGEAETVELDTGAAAVSVALDEQERLWIGREDGIDLVSRTGALLAAFDAPFEVPRELGTWTATFAGPPAFGSLWAYDPAGPTIHRLDPRDGKVTARIELADCPAIEYHRNYPNHEPLIYPVAGVNGMADAIVASCPMDVHHQYPGPMHVIDPASDTVVSRIEIDSSYGRGVVLDGTLWIPMESGMSRGRGGTIVRIDPRSSEIASIAGLPLQPGDRPKAVIVMSGDALWALVMTGRSDCSPTMAPCRSVIRVTARDLEGGGR